MKFRNLLAITLSLLTVKGPAWFFDMPDIEDAFEINRHRIDSMNRNIIRAERKTRDTFINGDSRFIETKSINFSFEQNDEFSTISCTLPEFINDSDIDARWGKNNVIISIQKVGFVLNLVIKEKQYSAEAYFVQNVKDDDANISAHSSLNQSISQVREFVNYVDISKIDIALEKSSNKLIVVVPFSEKTIANENKIPIKILD
jgi:hypothetical protein